MDSLLFASIPANGLNSGATRYFGPNGFWGTDYVSATEANIYELVASAGTFSNLKIYLQTAPGSGKSWTFTVRKNGVDTALTLSIADTATSGTDTTHSFTVAAGDKISIKAVPSGTPEVNTTVGCVMRYTGDTSKESLFMAVNGLNSELDTSTLYIPVSGSAVFPNATETNRSQIISAPGTISKLFVEIKTASVATRDRTFTLMLNGVATALTCVITGGNTTANDTTHSVNVVAGDLVSLRCESTILTTATIGYYGCAFTATTDGQFNIISVANAPDVSSTNVQLFFSTLSNDWGASEGGRINGDTLSINNWYFKVGTAPSSGKSWTFTLVVAGSDSACVVTIANAATTGNDTTHTVSITAGNIISLKSVPSGTPTGAVTTKWGFTGTIVQNLDVSVSDAVTVSESITIDDMLNPSVSDAVTVTESINLDLIREINVLDAVFADDLRYNMITNPSFEVNTSGWSAYQNGGTFATTIVRDTSMAQFGTASLNITATGSGNFFGTSMSVSGLIIGANYTLSVYAKSNGAGGEVLNFLVGNFTSTGLLLTTGWVQYSLTFRATSTSHTIFIRTSTVGTNWNIDGVMIEHGTLASPGTYFDGSISPAAWTGSAHASTSILNEFAENTYVEIMLDVAVSDSITVTEFNSFFFNEYNVSVIDAVTISESVSISISARRDGSVVKMRSNQQAYPITLDLQPIIKLDSNQQKYPLPMDTTDIL